MEEVGKEIAMEEEVGKEVVLRFFENDAIKFSFTIIDGRMANIEIKTKEGELFPIIEMGDKRRLLNWLNNLSMQLYQYLGTAPAQLLRKTERENDELIAKVPVSCPRCNGKDLEMRGSCCGGRGNVLACTTCGLKLKVKAQDLTDERRLRLTQDLERQEAEKNYMLDT